VRLFWQLRNIRNGMLVSEMYLGERLDHKCRMCGSETMWECLCGEGDPEDQVESDAGWCYSEEKGWTHPTRVAPVDTSKEPKSWPKMESEDRSRYVLDPSLYSPEQKAEAKKWKRVHGGTLEFMRSRVMPTATPTKQPVTQGKQWGH
jgi:hypothetical protein